MLTFKILKLLKLLELLKGNCFLVLVDDKLNVNQLLVKAVNRVNLFLIRQRLLRVLLLCGFPLGGLISFGLLLLCFGRSFSGRGWLVTFRHDHHVNLPSLRRAHTLTCIEKHIELRNVSYASFYALSRFLDVLTFKFFIALQFA